MNESKSLELVVPDKVLVQPVPTPQLPSLNDVAKVMHASGYFSDIRSVAQAGVKIMAGQELGVPPFASITGIHIIKGKPSMGANLMAGLVRAKGYDYKVKRLDKKGCVIEFLGRKEGGKRESLGESPFLEEDFIAAKIEGSGKPDSNWQKWPRNMYFARAVSNGVKWYCPDVMGGIAVYTPEELGARITSDGEVDSSNWSEDSGDMTAQTLGTLIVDGIDVPVLAGMIYGAAGDRGKLDKYVVKCLREGQTHEQILRALAKEYDIKWPQPKTIQGTVVSKDKPKDRQEPLSGSLPQPLYVKAAAIGWNLAKVDQEFADRCASGDSNEAALRDLELVVDSMSKASDLKEPAPKPDKPSAQQQSGTPSGDEYEQ